MRPTRRQQPGRSRRPLARQLPDVLVLGRDLGTMPGVDLFDAVVAGPDRKCVLGRTDRALHRDHVAAVRPLWAALARDLCACRRVGGDHVVTFAFFALVALRAARWVFAASLAAFCAISSA